MAGSWLARPWSWRLVFAALGVLVSACGVPEYKNAPLCTDGKVDGTESDVDCGGTCSPCSVGKTCQSNADCLNLPCTAGRCMADHCQNQFIDSSETDLDCGGGECAPCGNGLVCLLPADCASVVCSEGLCRAARCGDQVQNGTETDLDCGGADCPACPGGLRCQAHSDCASRLCEASGVCAMESCSDGLLTGVETSPDCGGPICPPCPNQVHCLVSSDCASHVCVSEACVDASCVDSEVNGNETDTDCGGTDCSPCGSDKACILDSDCASLLCLDGRCLAPTCSDSRPNGNETDVDCGGKDCTGLCQPNETCAFRCVAGMACVYQNDCESSVCTDNVCQPPACPDGARNGTETDADCGGGACAPCLLGRACLLDRDCLSGKCIANQCAAPTCKDTVKNGSESAVDCGGGSCPPCPAESTCTSDVDCESRICSGLLCAKATCVDGVRNGLETDADCGGGTCLPCPEVGQKCNQASDCATLSCLGSVCAAASCLDAAKNGNETGLNCGGSCPVCADGLGCKQGSDCQSGVCTGGFCQTAICPDGARNGQETDVDCGGGACPTCGHYQICKSDSDCTSTFCSKSPATAATGTCQDPRCGDGATNGTETDLDCGGYCAPCPDLGLCKFDQDCQSRQCVGGTCQYATCSDTIKNGPETDLDCGGAVHFNGEVCNPCPDGSSCRQHTDCKNKVCAGSGTDWSCQAPTCQDGTQNGSETGPDCGGSCVGVTPGCADGLGCQKESDCRSGVCKGSVCQVPTCTDLVKNGTETAIDCGGECRSCPDGSPCGNGNDCVSKVCDATLKTCSPPTCKDLTQNGNETGPDCGGSTACPRCGQDRGCLTDSDCDTTANLVCHSAKHICVAYTCNDTIQNGEETDLNCGGSICGKCADGAKCNAERDCTSGVCSGSPQKTCQVPKCSDGVKNGLESALDCGADPTGVNCPKCPPGRACETASNCDSGVCLSLVCQEPTCADRAKNGNELGMDCGGTCLALVSPQRCPDGTPCTSDADCTSTICAVAARTCTQASCTDGHQNLNETDIDCGGGTCSKCTGGRGCKVKLDCVSDYCGSSGFCIDLPCTGLCTNPTVFTGSSYQSGNLGTSALCYETTAALSGVGCSNFVSTRKLIVNQQEMVINASNDTLPAKRNQGFCIQVTEGGQTFAAFNTW